MCQRDKGPLRPLLLPAPRRAWLRGREGDEGQAAGTPGGA